MALNVATVCDSISKLSVTGLTILDIDEIPTSALDRNLPIVFPEPVDFLTNLSPETAAFGEGAGSEWDVEFDIKYTLLYAPVGEGRGMEKFAPTMTLALAFIETIMLGNPLAGAVLVRPSAIGTPGPMTDPDGSGAFFGVSITLHVLEFVN